MHTRASFGSCVLGIVALGLLGACGADSRRDREGPDTAASAPTGEAVAVITNVVHRDEKSGLPRFAWLDVKASAKGHMKGKPAREAAWGTFFGVAKTYGLDKSVIASAELESVHDTGSGPVIARFKQRLDGVDVFRSQMNIALSRDLDPVAASGSLARVPRSRQAFTLAPRAAVAAAARAFGTALTESDVTEAGALAGDYARFVLRRGALGDRREVAPARAKKVWFEGAKGLVPGYYVELHLGTDAIGDAQLRSFVVSAVDGAVLYQQSMTASDAFSYRVYADADGARALHPYAGPQGNAGFPHPTGAPNGFDPAFVSQNLVTLGSFPFSQNDPWLPAGATVTTGNNVDAFANLVAPDGFGGGDLRPTTTGPNVFDYPYDHSQQPGSNVANVQSGAVQLFYTVNFMHDWFYDAGYDEAAHNPQADNYGRGGVAGDPVTAQAQDVGGRNNANASTPADGASPRIRMYIFDGFAVKKLLTPAGDKEVNTVAWGPKFFLQPGTLAEVSPALGCDPIDNPADVAGKIALIDRGVCSAQIKVQNAQAAGAIGVVIANNQPGAPPSFSAVAEIDPGTTTIPTLTITQADGAALHAAVAGGAVEVTLRRDEAVDKDGSLDTSVVAHEWGHTLSNRLIGNGNGITGTQAGGMGEGWSDFVALLTLSRQENASVPSNPDWSGSFAVGSYDEGGAGNDGYYFGIRRVPYSVDFNKNPLTFKHVENGVALPNNGAPISFGQNGASNAEVHNTGEVWATMLWECYVSLLRDPRYTFEQANERMRRYLVASLKLTPIGPSITEARDAVLAAAYATDKQDFNHFALAFARRGAGVGAKSPAHESTTNAGVVESYVTGADVDIVSAKVEGTVSPCNPYGILRNGEHGKLTVTLRNAGTAPLLATTMTVSSPGGQMTFPGGAVVNVPPILPYATLTTVTDVVLDGAGFAASVDTQIDVTDPDLAIPRTVTLTYTGDTNYDVALNASRTDMFDTPVSAWTVASDAALDTTFPWALVPEGTKQRWSLRDSATTSDHSLVTPDLLVAGAGFKVTFDHRYSFEASSGKNFDGGVLEASIDGGVNWTDIGALASPGYNGIIDFAGSTNPLKSRAGFTAQSAGYPAYQTTIVALGAAFNGSTVKVRFRAGTDEGTGAVGWDITRASFDGVTNSPFPMRVPVAACVADPGVVVGDGEGLVPRLARAPKRAYRSVLGVFGLR